MIDKHQRIFHEHQSCCFVINMSRTILVQCIRHTVQKTMGDMCGMSVSCVYNLCILLVASGYMTD